MPYELSFPVTAGNPEPIQRIAAAVKNVQEAAKGVNPAMADMDAKVKALTSSGLTLAQALAKISEEEKKLTPALNATSTATASANNNFRIIGTTLQTHTVPQVAAASAALRTLEGHLSIRAAERFITTFRGMGPVLQAAFPVFGAIAFAEVLGQMVGKVGDMYNAWNPVIRAQEKSLAILKSSIPELEKLTAKEERLTEAIRRRQFGSGYALQLQESTANRDAGQDAQTIATIRSRIVTQQGIVTANTQKPTLWEPGGRLLPKGQVAEETIKGLQAQLEDAIYQQKVHLLEAENARAELGKESLTKERERQSKIESINKAIDAIRERSIALGDKAELSRFGAVGTLEEGRRAMERRYGREDADVLDAARINRLGGPDTVRVPQSVYDSQRAAIATALAADRASIGRELAAAAFKQAEEYKISAAQFQGYDVTHESPGVQGFNKLLRTLNIGDLKDSEKRFRADEQIRQIGIGSEREGINRASSRAGILSRRPGASEGENIAAAYRLRLDLMKQLAGIEQASVNTLEDSDVKRVAQAKLLADVTKERGEAELELTAKIADLRLKAYEQSRNFSGGLFDAAIGGGKSISNFVRGQALGVGRTIFQNAATPIVSSIASSLHVGGGSPLAGLLQGTPFGADPVKQATDANTLATIANTQALGALGGFSVGAAGGSGGGALSAITGAFGGGATGPLGMIFSHNGSGGGGAAFPSPSNSTVDYGDGGPISSGPKGGGGLFSANNIGKAGAVVGAGFGIYNGIKTGGARGTLSAISSAAGAAFVLDPEPISKAILGGVAIASGVVGAILGDPKQARSAEITRQLKYSQYVEPVAVHASMATGGGYSDYDRFGNVRGSSLSPFGPVQQPYFDYRHETTVPGTGGSGPGGPITVNHYVSVSALDSKSFIDRSPDIAAAVARDFQTNRIVADAMRRTNT